jgi:IclR family acetate operon transcriptional repressor
MQDLVALAREVQELANLVIPVGHEVTYIAQSNGRKGQGGIQMFTQLGARVPMYCTAVGKSILAHMPEEELNRILEEESLIAHTPYTITNVFQLREDLKTVRRTGYAIDNEEREIGVRCVACPVWDSTDRVIAAIGISGPSGRVTSELCEEYAPTVLATAQYISRQLGYKGDFHLVNAEDRVEVTE